LSVIPSSIDPLLHFRRLLIIMPPRTKRKNKDKWNGDYPLQYGFKVVSRHMDTFEPISVACQFCPLFGREEPEVGEEEQQQRALAVADGTRVKKRRKQTKNTKILSGPNWRTDKFLNHLDCCHPKKYEEYRASSKAVKQQFFSIVKGPPTP
jgi:hypothetical protein